MNAQFFLELKETNRQKAVNPNAAKMKVSGIVEKITTAKLVAYINVNKIRIDIETFLS